MHVLGDQTNQYHHRAFDRISGFHFFIYLSFNNFVRNSKLKSIYFNKMKINITKKALMTCLIREKKNYHTRMLK